MYHQLCSSPPPPVKGSRPVLPKLTRHSSPAGGPYTGGIIRKPEKGSPRLTSHSTPVGGPYTGGIIRKQQNRVTAPAHHASPTPVPPISMLGRGREFRATGGFSFPTLRWGVRGAAALLVDILRFRIISPGEGLRRQHFCWVLWLHLSKRDAQF